MIEQYLSNTNERATVSILQNILELNKAWVLPLWKTARKECLKACTPYVAESLRASSRAVRRQLYIWKLVDV